MYTILPKARVKLLWALERSEFLDTEEAKGRYFPGNDHKVSWVRFIAPLSDQVFFATLEHNNPKQSWEKDRDAFKAV